jgi:hypothetical protein
MLTPLYLAEVLDRLKTAQIHMMFALANLHLAEQTLLDSLI